MTRRARIFVLSCGRTGTTALAHHLRALLPEATVRHEPALWLLLRRMSVRMLTGRSGHMDGQRLLSILRFIERRRRTGKYVETTPALWGFAPVLPQVFPGCTLIHLVRNPHDYVASAYRFRSHWHLKGRLLTAVPDLYPRPESLGAASTWAQMTGVERSAWFWATVNDYISRCLATLPEPHYRFHFEQLYGPDQDMNAIRHLAELLGVGDQSALIERLRGKPINTSARLRPAPGASQATELEEAVRRWAGATATQLGYPSAPGMRDDTA